MRFLVQGFQGSRLGIVLIVHKYFGVYIEQCKGIGMDSRTSMKYYKCTYMILVSCLPSDLDQTECCHCRSCCGSPASSKSTCFTQGLEFFAGTYCFRSLISCMTRICRNFVEARATRYCFPKVQSKFAK